MDLDLKSKTAVVTGASIGIGRAIARGLALEGVRVVGVARRKDLLDAACAGGQGGRRRRVIPVTQDIMQEDAAKKLAAAAIAELGHVDILVNNAGGSRPLPVDAPDSDWDEAIALEFYQLPEGRACAAAANDRAPMGPHHQHHRQVRTGGT